MESEGSPKNPTNPISHPTNGICGDGRDLPNPAFETCAHDRFAVRKVFLGKAKINSDRIKVIKGKSRSNALFRVKAVRALQLLSKYKV